MPRNRPHAQPAWLKPGRAGGAVLRTRNPYGNPCPQCGARRYERCFVVQGTATFHTTDVDRMNGISDNGEFIYIKDKPCSRRVPLTLGIGYDDDNERDQEVSHDDYSGCDT